MVKKHKQLVWEDFDKDGFRAIGKGKREYMVFLEQNTWKVLID